jgi:hypothetical protein
VVQTTVHEPYGATAAGWDVPPRVGYTGHVNDPETGLGRIGGQVSPITSPPMSRPLRIEFPGAVFHITSRGDRREPIYRDDADRVTQLAVLDEATLRFDVSVLAYCLMGNHYHLVLCTRSGALSRLMRHLNGV